MGDVDLTGLPEAPVDSEDEEEEEDEDIDRTSDPLLGRDVVRECLEKEPADKTDDDIGEEKKKRSLYKTISYIISERSMYVNCLMSWC